MASIDSLDSLRNIIRASGAPDSYIDQQEEDTVFQRGETLGLSREVVEGELNAMCRENRWTRESDVAEDLRDQLLAATGDDHALNQKEFYHCVNYGVSMHMPRRQALAFCVRHVIDQDLRIKRSWLGLGPNWFEPLKRQYGGGAS